MKTMSTNQNRTRKGSKPPPSPSTDPVQLARRAASLELVRAAFHVFDGDPAKAKLTIFAAYFGVLLTLPIDPHEPASKRVDDAWQTLVDQIRTVGRRTGKVARIRPVLDLAADVAKFGSAAQKIAGSADALDDLLRRMGRTRPFDSDSLRHHN